MPTKRVRDTAGESSLAGETAGEEWADAEALAVELAGEAPTSGGLAECPVCGSEVADETGDGESVTCLTCEWEGPYAEAVAAELAGDVEPEPEPEPETAEPAPAVAVMRGIEHHRALLRSLGARRATLIDELAGVDAEIHAEIPVALAAGVPKQVIAKDAGVARQTVYNVLGKEAG